MVWKNHYRRTKSILRLTDPDMCEAYIATSQTKPSNLLKGENSRLIDEWQEAPELWDAIRTSVDQRRKPGLYIITGSTTINKENIYTTPAPDEFRGLKCIR